MPPLFGVFAKLIAARKGYVVTVTPGELPGHAGIAYPRLMLSEDLDAAEAGYRVSYDDASHFSGEYKRHFGEPPMRDVERLRELATA
jgi:AraC-like DNA-binding protein